MTPHINQRVQVAEIFFLLKEKRLLSEFYRKTNIKNAYTSSYSFIRAINNLAFSIVEQVYQKSIEKIKMIIEEFKHFSHDYQIQL